ncbi:MAG: 16S rRNA (uracil(1498)-N(3))-methyltransferase [Clostridia bacterium]|nr:16S rRNA (uracil(1498)-N(3))-methyltransferase [Clostridia bacterium]
MPKFFINKEDIKDNAITISGQDATHISKVLRTELGETLTLCDGCGTDFFAQVTSITKEAVSLKIYETLSCLAEPKILVTLFQGIPKQGKMDYIIEKCTELGISRIVPVSAKRSVVKIDDKKSEAKKLERWRKIAAESVKQCGRGKIPEVTDVMSFSEAIEFSKSLDLTIAAYECERDTSIKSTLTGKTPKTIGVFIGPEGGIDDKEVKMLKDANIQTVTLGTRILRTETAGHTVLTAIMYEYNEFEQ